MLKSFNQRLYRNPAGELKFLFKWVTNKQRAHYLAYHTGEQGFIDALKDIPRSIRTQVYGTQSVIDELAQYKAYFKSQSHNA